MKSLTILQIGDLHFDQADMAPDADQKDTKVAPSLVAASAPGRFPAVMKAVQRRCAKNLPDGVAFCGDLTTRGCLSVYQRCLNYLDENLGLSEKRYWSDERIHAVPGNHDVKRSLADPNGENFFGKFEPLTAYWRELNTDVLACDRVRSTSIGEQGSQVQAFSLNSCVGCGERRARRGEFTEALREELEQKEKEGDQKAIDALWEGLDTPLFEADHLEQLGEEIDDLDRAVLPVVTSHHNLLPQATPRVEIYSELLNGGAARTRLASHGRPILYLHGHIHDDPIELIEQHYPHLGRILSISAPEFREGFNLIAIEFGTSGRPMGATITHYRYERGGEVRPKPEIRIGLASRDEVTHSILGDVLREVGPGETLRFGELVKRIPRVTDDALAGALREAEWVGHLTITNRSDKPAHWTISREVL